MEKFILTRTQEQFWFLNNLFKNDTAYNIPSVFKIKGIPDINYLQHSIEKLIERHEMLRVNFFEENGKIFQKANWVPSEFKIETASYPFELNEKETPDEIFDEIHKPFNLHLDKLLRVKLFTYKNNESILSIVFHHIIVDLHSKNIFATELSHIYNSLCSGQPIQLPELKFTFKQHAEKFHDWSNSEEAEKMLSNWKTEIGESVNPVDIPTDFDRTKSLSTKGERYNFGLNLTTSDKIKIFAKKMTVSPFVVLLSAYSILLNKLSQQQEISIGIPVTNRRWKNSDNIFGCFLNILPVKIDFSDDFDGISLIRQIQQKMIFAHRNQELPLFNLLNQPNYRSGTGANLLFQSGFTFDPLMKLQFDTLKVDPIFMERKGAQLELFLNFFEDNGQFFGSFEYSTDLFLRATIQRWEAIFLTIVDSLINTPEEKTGKIDVLPKNEISLLETWNNTDTPYENSLCIHNKLESQAAETPLLPALDFYNKNLTYNELNEHSNRLAHYMLEKGLQIEDKVGICLARSFEMMIAIFATLKAGGVFVPLEPESPKERFRMIAEDAHLKFILATKTEDSNLINSTNIIYIDDILTTNISENTSNPNINLHAHNLAYIIYTSGSTGKPKGVMIEHHSVINKIGWMQKEFPLLQGEEMIQKTPISFDVSVWELFWWSFNGGKLVILEPGGEKNPKSLVRQINAKNPSVLIFVPSVFSLFIDYLSAIGEADCLANIKWIMLIGEAFPPSVVNKFNKMYKGKKTPLLINTYGPTETTIAVSYYQCPKSDNVKKVYIGKPIDNTKLFIINQYNKLQPIGAPGELVITGVNLARGYQGAPGLTEQKFINLLLPTGDNIRAYKTGDLAKWDINGELDFIGRVDNQVKIRGIRIELGDIESKILESPIVNEAAVIVSDYNPKNKSLIGYVVLNKGESDKSKEIIEFLQQKLPSYMIPAQIIELKKMPLTSSGKINRRLLPAPKFTSKTQFIAPASTYEKQLDKLWKDTLKLEKLSITDNFFELGGDSMLAFSLITKIQENMNINIDVIKIMEYPNIKTFANYLANKIEPNSESSKDIENRAALRKNATRSRRARNN